MVISSHYIEWITTYKTRLAVLRNQFIININFNAISILILWCWYSYNSIIILTRLFPLFAAYENLYSKHYLTVNLCQKVNCPNKMIMEPVWRWQCICYTWSIKKIFIAKHIIKLHYLSLLFVIQTYWYVLIAHYSYGSNSIYKSFIWNLEKFTVTDVIGLYQWVYAFIALCTYEILCNNYRLPQDVCPN